MGRERLMKPRVDGQGVTTVKGWWASIGSLKLEEGLAQSHRIFPQSSVPWAFLKDPLHIYVRSPHLLAQITGIPEGLGFV